MMTMNSFLCLVSFCPVVTYGLQAFKHEDKDDDSELVWDFVKREVDNGFKLRFNMPRDHFAERLRDIVTRGQKEPASAQMISNGFGWRGGFTSRANMFINEMAMAMYFDRSITICNSTCMFEAVSVFYDLHISVYNDPSRIYEENWDFDVSKKCLIRPMQIGRSVFAPNFLLTDFQYITDLKRFLHASVLVLKPAVRTKLASILSEAGFEQDKKFVGVQIRHGDKGSEAELISFGTYAKAVEEALSQPGMHRSVYVASDDPEAKDAMKALLPNDVAVWQQFDDGSSSREYNDEESFQSLLLDLEALRMSEVFIGTHSSNIGSFVFHSRPASKSSISLDDKWEEVPFKNSDADWQEIVADWINRDHL